MKGLGVKTTLLQASRSVLWLPLNVLRSSLSDISFRDCHHPAGIKLRAMLHLSPESIFVHSMKKIKSRQKQIISECLPSVTGQKDTKTPEELLLFKENCLCMFHLTKKYPTLTP